MASVYKSVAKTPKTKDKEEDDTSAAEKKNHRSEGPKQRVLILSSRGVTYRHRHILNDLHALLPHSRKDAKLDTKTKLYQLNELADLYSCNNVLFFEARKAKDLYLWMSKAPNGPTIKMHMQNLHTMSELHFPGNCLKGSRPILSFDKNFDTAPHLLVIKELLTHVFNVPQGARKSKPFIDHVMNFAIADNKIWIRCYEIQETAVSKGARPAIEENPGEEPELSSKSKSKKKPKDHSKDPPKQATKAKSGETNMSLVEIGPRFVLTPIVILQSSFGGPVIYENDAFVSPNETRSQIRQAKSVKYHNRAEQDVERKSKKGELGLRSGSKRKVDELDDSELFA